MSSSFAIRVPSFELLGVINTLSRYAAQAVLELMRVGRFEKQSLPHVSPLTTSQQMRLAFNIGLTRFCRSTANMVHANNS